MLIVSIDGGCPGVENVEAGVIGATSQQYPHKMAAMALEAIASGTLPEIDPAAGFLDTGATLITAKPVDGVPSISVEEGRASAGADRLLTQRRDWRLSWTNGGRRANGVALLERAPGEERLMSDDAAGRQAAGTGRSWSGAPAGAAQLRRGDTPAPLRRVQHFLHDYPTTIPVYRPRARRRDLQFAAPAAKFFAPLNLSLVLQQVTIIAHSRHRADAGDPHRRHRPLGRR